jgi:spore maturation protein CgeB
VVTVGEMHSSDSGRDLITWLTANARGAVLEVGPETRLDELPDAAFDSVLVRGALERSADPRATVRDFARAARPAATIAIVTQFGHVPGNEHRTTFYVGSLLDALAGDLQLESVEIIDSHFRILARPGSTGEDERLRMLEELQPSLEIRFVQAQVDAQRQARRAARRRERLAKLRRRYRRESRRAKRARAELQRARARRPVARLRRRFKRADRSSRPSNAPTRAPRVRIPEVELPAGPVARPDLAVAVILDEFSATALRYEWNQIEFGPYDWRQTLERQRPRLLFVESAWQGNDGRWAGAMQEEGPTQPLRDLVSWCRSHEIPTVFWSKEDPPNFDRFLATARLFDRVFTVDGDCIPRYREALGHDRVGLLRFAAQPRIHHPVVVEGGREYDVAFAGSYFAHKHPIRRQQMEALLEPALEAGLHVYTRLPGVTDRDFPDRYAGHVVGSLPYERMTAAYKRYKLFLNVNSVTDSPTMCARRAFELSACATPVLSGPSRGLEAAFGDAIPIADSPEETRQQLRRLLADGELRDRLAHRALREVLSAHTYGHRVDQVLGEVGLPVADRRQAVSVLLATKRAELIDEAISQVASQTWRPLQLVIVLHGLGLDPTDVAERARRAGIEHVVALEADRSLSLGACMNLALDAADGDLVAKMDDDDLYGEHYLADLVNAFQFADASIVGKAAHYVHLPESGTTMLRFEDREHTYVEHVKGATITARADVLRALRFDDVRAGVDTALFARCRTEGIRIYAGDRFSFAVVRRQGPHAHSWAVSHGKLLEDARSVSNAPLETHVRV